MKEYTITGNIKRTRLIYENWNTYCEIPFFINSDLYDYNTSVKNILNKLSNHMGKEPSGVLTVFFIKIPSETIFYLDYDIVYPEALAVRSINTDDKKIKELEKLPLYVPGWYFE